MKKIKKIIVKASFIYLILEFGFSLPLILFMYFKYSFNISFILLMITLLSALILALWGDEK